MYCCELGMSLPSNVSLIIGKRVLQECVWEYKGNGSINSRPWRQIWRLCRRNVGSQKYWNFLDISTRGRDPDLTSDVTACRGTIKGPSSDRRIIVRVDRLGSPLESLFGALSAVRASKLLDAERY
ncbi:hypothetical protein AVEN_33091-1 [Araneus ventricosus]|uniref:Uncharacterized protein n=1 Tax=Araneus ventricosus TaxID=182803 RepID=A0A4Y2CTW2_ARAVE|nr:hypothetical protein AVEN_33091-1 [Araneus ventricosus]